MLELNKENYLMRNVFKSALVAAMMLAVMAVGASSASAAVVVTNEDDSPTQGVACGAVSLSDHTVVQATEECAIHAIQRESIDLEIFGVTASRCNNEYTATVSSAGAGYLSGQSLTDIPGQGDSCTVIPCAEADGHVRPWPISLAEAGVANNYNLTATFCVQRTDGSQTNCTLTVPVAVAGHTNAIFGTTDGEYSCAGTGGLIQVHGSWTTEDVGDEDIEIRHS